MKDVKFQRLADISRCRMSIALIGLDCIRNSKWMEIVFLLPICGRVVILNFRPLILFDGVGVSVILEMFDSENDDLPVDISFLPYPEAEIIYSKLSVLLLTRSLSFSTSGLGVRRRPQYRKEYSQSYLRKATKTLSLLQAAQKENKKPTIRWD